MTWRRGRRRGKHSAPGLKTRVSGAKFPVDLPVCVRKGVTHTKVFRLEKPVKTVFQPPGLSASEGKCFAALGAVLFGIVCRWAEVRIAWRLSAVLDAEGEGVGRSLPHICSLLQAFKPSCPHDITCGHSCFATWCKTSPIPRTVEFCHVINGQPGFVLGYGRKGRKTLGGETRIRSADRLGKVEKWGCYRMPLIMESCPK